MSLEVSVGANLTPEELWDFYDENFCCEARYGIDKAFSAVQNSSVVVIARLDGRLVGLGRALSDGNESTIMELSVALSQQGPNAKNETGALLEDDAKGTGNLILRKLTETLHASGVCWIQTTVYGTEVKSYVAAGFSPTPDHTRVIIDTRPKWKYAGNSQPSESLTQS